MLNKKIGITFIGDSIMSFKKNSPATSWLNLVSKKMKTKLKNKIIINAKQIVGLNTRGLLNIISDYYLSINKKDILVIQIGINDSWHYKSLGGIAEVSLSSFKKNLAEIVKKSKISGFKYMIFINYHKLLNNRIEVNKKTINFNLNKYNKEIKLFCKRKNINLINIRNKNFKPKNYCLPMPDGVHLNHFGAKFYSKVIFKYILDFIYEKKL